MLVIALLIIVVAQGPSLTWEDLGGTNADAAKERLGKADSACHRLHGGGALSPLEACLEP
eukprot:COSAG01_NODE_23721_length_804_cov_0.804255_1_plen_60_part_00